MDRVSPLVYVEDEARVNLAVFVSTSAVEGKSLRRRAFCTFDAWNYSVTVQKGDCLHPTPPPRRPCNALSAHAEAVTAPSPSLPPGSLVSAHSLARLTMSTMKRRLSESEKQRQGITDPSELLTK